VVILNNWGGDDDKDRTPTATLDKEAIALTQVVVWATQTVTALTPAPTETPTATNTVASEPSFTPETPTLTYTPTEKPSNTPGPTETPTITSTATFIPAGAANEDWTPIEREINGVPVVYVPAGCFMMGSTDEEIEATFQQCEIANGVGKCDRAWYEDELPVHRVCLTAYWIGKTEVTNAQYRQCVEAEVCTLPGGTQYYDDPDYAGHPVVNVNWEQAKTYAAWVGGSLPTEAQWEYAARGPDGWTYPWGADAATCDLANVWIGDSGCVGNTKAVGSYPDGASWVGALDISGNVLEWAADWYSEDYYVTLADGVVDPTGPGNGDARVLRGGDWFNFIDRARCAFRSWYDPRYRLFDGGFRVVCASPL